MTAQPKAKKGTTMVEKQELSVREKKELVAKEEKTISGRYYIPYADIYETDDALAVVLEMPGMEKKDLMPLIFSQADMAVMQRIKDALDPKGLCNPGKVFPTAGRCLELFARRGRAVGW